MWPFYLTITIGASVTVVLLLRHLQRDHKLDPGGYFVASGLLAGLMIAAIAMLDGVDTRWHLLPVGNLVLTTVLWAAANLFQINALRSVDASLFGIVFTTRVLWTIAASLIFLDESLSIWDGVGTFVLLSAAVVAVWEKGVSLKNHGLLLSLATAATFGVAVANDGVVVSNGYDVIDYFVFAFAAPAAAYALVSQSSRQKAVEIIKNPTVNRYVFVLSFLMSLGGIFLFKAFQEGQNLSVLSSINQVQTVLIVLGAMIFLRERKSVGRRLLASAASVVGVSIIILG